MDWKTTKLPASRCPLCGLESNAASSPEGATPDPGDITICMHCAGLLVFTDDMRLRTATNAEIAELPRSAALKVRTYQTAVENLHRVGR